MPAQSKELQPHLLNKNLFNEIILLFNNCGMPGCENASGDRHRTLNINVVSMNMRSIEAIILVDNIIPSR